jgi:hypothetical protein
MKYGTRFLVAVVFRACVVRSIFQIWPLPLQLSPQSATRNSLSLWMAVAVSNAPVISVARHYSLSDDSLDRPRSLWNPLKQSPTLARSLQQDSDLTDQDVNANANANNSNPLGTSVSAEEGKTIDDNSVNDDLDNSVDDDFTVVVPLDFSRGENIDDGVFTEEEGPLSSTTSPSGSDNRIAFWTCGIALVSAIAGYIMYRRRERSIWREYRTHRILQEHVEAFDLSFQDEDDDVELSNF